MNVRAVELSVSVRADVTDLLALSPDQLRAVLDGVALVLAAECRRPAEAPPEPDYSI